MNSIFDETIDRRGTYCTQWDYIADRFGTADLLPFTISDTDFAIPDQILQVLKKRLEHRVFGYSRWNNKDFAAAATGWYARRYDCAVPASCLIYSPTVLFALALLLEIICEHGDTVLLPTPAYDAFLNMIPACGLNLEKNRLHYDGYSYSINFAEFEQQARKSKVLIWCNPHNPTGRVWSSDETSEVMRICRKYNVFVISDEIHADIIYDQRRFTTAARFAGPDLAILTSCSKTFNTPGLLSSYGFIFSDSIREKYLSLLKQKYALSCPPVLGLLAHITAYNECSGWVDSLVNYLNGNMQLIADFIAKHNLPLKFTKPEGTYLAWIDCAGLGLDDPTIQKLLIEHGKVAIMSGNTYEAKNFLRLNAGCPRSKLLNGLEHMKKAFSQLP